MSIWVLTDDAGRIVALNPNCMDGNSGWSETTEEALGLAADADLNDDHGAALYALQDGAAVPRSAAERETDWADEQAPPPASDDLVGRVTVAEGTIATHDQEISQIVSGLEALANG